MDGKLCPEIHPPPLAIFTPLFQGKPPPFNSEIFQTPPFLKFWLESQTPPPFRKGGGGGGAHYVLTILNMVTEQRY